MSHTASIKIKAHQPAKSSNTENPPWHKPSIYSKKVQINNYLYSRSEKRHN